MIISTHRISRPGEPEIRRPKVGVGRCIYCDREPPQIRLTEEHIIPKGLGGNLILPGSSCERCAAITGRFEQRLLRDTFRFARGALGIFSGRKKSTRQTHLP
ncbi:HNH endonuclease [Mesorhizobium sp. M1143]|uniref:HNH endonuclease n=1 Tax=Mesorhizobium sp. M1143 TaxID=2957061 RepID=UPI00333BA93C